MDMPEAELEPKAWAQQLANHLVECLHPELVLRVQQGVRDELQSFFGAHSSGIMVPPVRQTSANSDTAESKCAEATEDQLLHEPPPMLSSVNLEVSEPKCEDCTQKTLPGEPPKSLNMKEPNSSDHTEKRRLSEPVDIFMSAHYNSEPELQKPSPSPPWPTNGAVNNATDAEYVSEEQLDGMDKEYHGNSRKSVSSDTATAAAAAAASCAWLSVGPKSPTSRVSARASLRGGKRAQTANFEERCRSEDDEEPILIRRHYRAFSTAKEIKAFEKEKQAETYVHLLRDMSRSSSKILTQERRPSQAENIFNVRLSNKNQSGLKRCLIHIVTNVAFDYTVGLVIVLNAAAIGIQTDWTARNVGTSKQLPLAFTVTEWCFAVFFIFELAARMFIYGRHFFTMSGRNWNIFDCLVVALQLIEQLFLIIRDGSGSYNLSVFRMLRFLRLVRVIRLARIMRLIGELRTIVVSIMSSMRSLGWTVCLLLLMIYMVAVYLTQLVADWRDWRLERREEVESEDVRTDGMYLQYYYGSVPRSVLSLYQSISGGLSWDVACNPLITYISPLAGILFSLYIAFAILAIMNVVTGVFVESALVTARNDKDVVMLNNVREVFALSDEDGDGCMTWEEFKQHLDKSELQELFQNIGIDPKEARALFQLLDFDGTGSINLAEFYDGCVRMKGEAKAIDLLTVMYENRQTSRKIIVHLKAIERGLQGLFEFLKEGGEESKRRNSKQEANSCILID